MDKNLNIDFLIRDEIKGAVEGFGSREAEDNKVRIFLDICRFKEDYPASSEALNAVKHNAGALCPHCTFCYSNTHVMQDYAYSPDIYSDDFYYTQRVDDLILRRCCGIGVSDTCFLSMNEGAFLKYIRE